jgi:hypothetical protein
MPVALGLLGSVIAWWGLALLWRVGSWHVSPAATLTYDEGLAIGSPAPEVACHAIDGSDRHLSFGGRTAMVVMGNAGCRPCGSLLRVAATHAATRSMRRVYLTDSDAEDLDPAALASWEVYLYHDEESVRDTWRAPVSPYFHVVDPRGAIVEKGVASESEHLDRILHLRPPSASEPTVLRLES